MNSNKKNDAGEAREAREARETGKAKKTGGAEETPEAREAAGTISIRFEGYGRKWPASLFTRFELEIHPGQTTVLLGPSGVGKSTILRLLAGLEKPRNGITVSGVPQNLKKAYMAQEVHLLNWMNVYENVAIGGRLRGTPCKREAVIGHLRELGLEDCLSSAPRTLSGGMAQRVALARTLLECAEINLLDEPFAALDALSQRKMQALIARWFQGRTVVLVTHDPFEAARLGDAIYVLQREDVQGLEEGEGQGEGAQERPEQEQEWKRAKCMTVATTAHARANIEEQARVAENIFAALGI